MNEKPLIDDKLYSLQEVAGMLRVSDRSVFRYIHGNKLKATKIGYWRISGFDLRRFLSENANIRQNLMIKEATIPVKVSNKKKK